MENYTKPDPTELRRRLTRRQFDVTQRGGTEPPFDNEFWNNKSPGIYVDVVSGEPLFSSRDKFDSGSGWPSFTQPLEPANIVLDEDHSLGMQRVEVRSTHAKSHLGHVFEDGPAPTGLRYCINSAALRFIPREQLQAKGYGGYDGLFEPRKGSSMTKALQPEVAILAGGCFWGVEDIIRKFPGVLETDVGYTGGSHENPTYQDVSSGKTGHAEAIRVVFDPTKLSYRQLITDFFRLHDPTTPNQQGNDIGTQYRSAIFYTSPQQKEIAERVKNEIGKAGKWPRPIVTTITPAGPFHLAETYHQDYLLNNPNGYTCHFLRNW